MLILLMVIQRHGAHFSLSLFINFSYSEKLIPHYFQYVNLFVEF